MARFFLAIYNNILIPYYYASSASLWVIAALNISDNYNLLWRKTFEGGLRVVRYGDKLIIANAIRYTDSNITNITIYIADPISGNILNVKNTIIYSNDPVGLFIIYSMSDYYNTVGYMMHGAKTIGIFDPDMMDWRTYNVSKPIYVSFFASRYNSYYAILYGTQEDSDDDWEVYITDLCGYEEYVGDKYHYSWEGTYAGTSSAAYITPNYVLLGFTTAYGDSTLTSYSWEPRSSGVLRVYSSVDATILVDGDIIGEVPSDSWSNINIPTGYHNITVVGGDGYLSVLSNININEEMILIEPVKPLLIVNGTVIIAAIRIGFNIYLNDSYIGSLEPGSNISLSLPPGVYNFTFTAEGRKPATVIVTLSPGENISIIDPIKGGLGGGGHGVLPSPSTPPPQKPIKEEGKGGNEGISYDIVLWIISIAAIVISTASLIITIILKRSMK